MRSLLYVLIWEYARRVWPMLLATIGLLLLGPMMIQGLFQLDGLIIEPGVMPTNGLHINYLGLAFFGFAMSAAVAQQGVRNRLYVMPISTGMLTAWLLITSIATAIIANVVVVLLYKWWFGVDWPVLGPCLFFAVAMAARQWIATSPLDFRLRRLALYAGVVAALVAWLLSRYHAEGWKMHVSLWSAPSATDVLTLFVAFCVLSLLSARAMSRHRHGETVPLPSWLFAARDAVLWCWQQLGFAAPTVASAADATRWLEWQKGRTLVLVAGGVMSLFILLVQIGGLRQIRTAELEGTLMILTMFPAIGGFMIGTSLNAPAGAANPFAIPKYLSAAPISDGQLAACFLANAFKAVVFIWIMLMAAGLLVPGWKFCAYGPSPFAPELERIRLWQQFGIASLPIALAMSFLTTWTIAGLGTVVSRIGSSPVMMSVWIAFVAIAIALTVLVRFVLPRESAGVATSIILATSATLSFAGTASAFDIALRRKLLDRRVAVCGIASWLVIATAVMTFWSTEILYRVSLAGLLTLAIAPLAATPLSVSWNRHR